MSTTTESEFETSESANQRCLLGFLGLLSLMGVQAFQQGEPLWLFWFAFAGFFSFFGYRWESMRYLGLREDVGRVVAILEVAGVLAV